MQKELQLDPPESSWLIMSCLNPPEVSCMTKQHRILTLPKASRVIKDGGYITHISPHSLIEL